MLKTLISTLLIASLAGCATATMSAGDSIARLESQQKKSPTSAAVHRSLGIAYFKANRLPEARVALDESIKLDPRDGTTALYLGLTAEAMNDLSAAKTAYSSYIKYGRTSRVRGQLQSKLADLTRKEIAADAKSAVAQEASMAGQPASPRTVAVLPLRFSGADTSLRALERGFAELLTTDLARSSQLQLVERARMQALVDEIRLQQTGATDAASNVRAGRLVRAGRVVTGSINQLAGDNIRVDAAVIDVPTSEIRGNAQNTDVLSQIFDIEKRIAMDLFSQLGVTLTPAERNLIEQRPTRSLAAFMAYSRGLRAEDEGRYDDASRFFNEATRIDPSFNQAQQKSAEVTAAAAGAEVTAASVETSLQGTTEGAVVSQAVQQGTAASATGGSTGLGSTAQTAAADLNPSPSGAATGGATSGGGGATSNPGQRDAVSAGTGADNPSTGTAKVTIVITRPRTP